MPLPLHKRKFTPRQLNALVDDAANGIFIPMGQGQKFEEALHRLARNPQRTEADIEAVRDLTKYNWRAEAAKRKTTKPQAAELVATHQTRDGRLAANIREGVFLIDGMLPLSDLEAHLRGIELEPLEEDTSETFTITAGMREMALAYQHPALAH